MVGHVRQNGEYSAGVRMSADMITLSSVSALRTRPTWYCWLLTGFYLYSVNLQGNVVPFLQAEFALSYRAVSLHSSAIAVGIILVGLLGEVRYQISGIRYQVSDEANARV